MICHVLSPNIQEQDREIIVCLKGGNNQWLAGYYYDLENRQFWSKSAQLSGEFWYNSLQFPRHRLTNNNIGCKQLANFLKGKGRQQSRKI